MERSITRLDDHIGHQIQVVAYGTSYIGELKSIDYDKGVMVVADDKDEVVIDLDQMESFASVETYDESND